MVASPVSKKDPIINVPMATRVLAIIMGFVFIAQEYAFDVTLTLQMFNTFGFVPTNFSLFTPDKWLSLFSPITYMFIHGSMVHLGINVLTLLAFGSGLERWLGARKFLILFFGSGLTAILVHFIIYTYDTHAVVGASGATSGLFAAGIIMLRHMGSGIGSGPYGIYPLVGLYVVMTLIFGLTNPLDGGSVAWVAHLGGFAAGLGVMKLMKKL